MSAIEAERRPATSRASRRPWIIAGGLAGAAAAVTVGVLVANGLTSPAPTIEAVPTREPGTSLQPSVTSEPSPEPPAEETPAEVLRGAAVAAAEFVSPALAPGQYLRREWTTEELYVYEDAFGSWATPGWGGSRDTATSAWLVGARGTQYIPADLASRWYGSMGRSELLSSFGDGAEAEAGAQVIPGMLGSRPQVEPYDVFAPWSVGGASDLASFFAAMPDDPEEMVNWIRGQVEPERPGGEDFEVGWTLIGLLSYNAGPPEVRATMYRALSLLPGSTVGEEQTGGARTLTFESRFGWASDPSDSSLTRFTVTIDMATGDIRETTYTSDVGEGIVPAEVPNSRMIYAVSVVDGLP
ncbi:hypothetical protein [Microbacterium phyllosphaerae]|uniref:hypothetical protein n=1 Tax=Microbacterium phyllosphaerae TaxID=124798 RepID=UPI003D657595